MIIDRFDQAMRNTVNEGSEDFKGCSEGFDILTTISIEADRDDNLPMIKVSQKMIMSYDAICSLLVRPRDE